MQNPRITFRLDESTRRRIDQARGPQKVSAWLRDAAVQRLEHERGLGPAFTTALLEHATQLRGLGTNLNQLAKAANQGQPVQVDDGLLRAILAEVRATRAQLGAVDKALRGQVDE